MAGAVRLAVGLALAVWAVDGAWPAAGPQACVVSSMVQVRPNDTCADHGTSCEEPLALVAGQRGETESFQVLLRKDATMDDRKGGLANVTVAVHAVDAAALARVSVFQVGYVFTIASPRYEGSGGGWRPDPLLRLEAGQHFEVPPGVAQALWFQVEIARNATPGTYNDTYVTITATPSDGRPVVTSIPLAVTVWNITLPSLAESTIGTAWSGSWGAGTFEPYYPGIDWNTSKHVWYDLMLDHRMPPDSIYEGSPRPIDDYVYLASKGVRWMALLDVQSVKQPAHVSYLDWPTATPTATGPAQHRGTGGFGGSCANYSQAYVDHLIATLRPVVAELEARGLLQYTYVYGFDENPVSCEPQVRQLFGATKAAFPTLRTAAVLNWSPMPTDLPVDVWTLQYEEFDAGNAKAWVAAGKQQWQYHCIEPHSLRFPNTFIERPGLQARLLFWLAALTEQQYGAPTGWLYYAVNLWRPCQSAACGGAHKPAVLRFLANTTGPFTDFPPANYIWQPEYEDIFVNGDGSFVYPCEEGPCGTIRLDNIRQGLEDWELLRRLTPDLALPLLTQLVRGPADWTNSYALLRRVRLEAARALELQQSGTVA